MQLTGLSFLTLVASLVGSATRLLAAAAPVDSVVPDPEFGLFRNLFPLVFVGGLIWLISRRVGKSTVMVFRHPTNGYEERVTNPFLWTMLFGPIYLASKGAWPYAILSLLCPPLWVFVFPFMAGNLIRRHYLRQGWQEVRGGLTVHSISGSAARD